MEDEKISRMLVLGTDVSNNKYVVDQLHALCDSEAVKPTTSALITPSIEKLVLRTKYYIAPVEVHCHHVLENAFIQEMTHPLSDYEALIWVTDLSHPESFLHAHQAVQKLVDEQSFDVCLLVSHASDKTVPDNIHVQRVNEWCQDHAFEFVDLNSLVSDASATSLDSGEEKQGMDRVLEALHCNMWRSMELVTASTNANQTETKTTGDNDQDKAESEPIKSDKTSAERSTEDDATVNIEREEGDERLQTLLRALEIAGPPDEPSSAATTSQNNSNDIDDDVDMAEFNALIEQVRRVREHGDTLSDQERRQQAADVAMKLWSFIGGEDTDDED